MNGLFNWSSDFITDLPEVDQQHQRLVHLINDLAEFSLSKTKLPEELLADKQSALINYCAIHFRDETKLMVQSGLDARHVKYHVEQHKLFTEEITRLSSSVDLDNPQSLQTLLSYLINWLAFHILGVDQGMARQLRAIESGLSAEQAH